MFCFSCISGYMFSFVQVIWTSTDYLYKSWFEISIDSDISSDSEYINDTITGFVAPDTILTL